MILDTSFIIALMREDAGAMAKLEEMLRKNEPQLLTAITIFELATGAVRYKHPAKERELINRTLRGQIILPFDAEAARVAGDLNGALVNEGKTLGPQDVMIASIALTKKDAVLTRNVKDFSRIPGLRVETF